MPNFWKVVNSVIAQADVLLLVLDARYIELTRHEEIEQKIKAANKPLIYVFTKCDLVDKSYLEKQKKGYTPSVFISGIKHYGITKLRERIIIEGKKQTSNQTFKVGVLGYPNVGKSSLINSLKGKKSASTSNQSGHTRGIQKVKADNKILFLDTPGVIPFQEKDQLKHALIGTVDFSKIKDAVPPALHLLVEAKDLIAQAYQVELNQDEQENLETLALACNMIKKGAQPDIQRMARKLLQDWQTGKIHQNKN